MPRESQALEAASQVEPRALQSYAHGLGWQLIPNGKRPEIAIYHRPDSRLHQVVVPIDPTLSDYGEAVVQAVRKLAEFESRPFQDVLEHLLLPPADLLKFREKSRDAEAGNLPFDHAVRMINGTKKLLLSAAHSVLVPQPYHPRLSRSEAEEFVNRCRLGQTERGSFVLNVACPLGAQLPFATGGEPFARIVIRQLMQALAALVTASESQEADEILNPERTPGISANFCESLLQLRPAGDRSTLTVAAFWSRAFLPLSKEPLQQVQLDQPAFEVAEYLAPRLRTGPQPVRAQFVAFVDAIRGQPTREDPRPSGEVDFTIFDDQEGEIHARGVLSPTDYAEAGKAHLASAIVAFKGILRRVTRMSRVDQISEFAIVELDHPGESAPTPPGAPVSSASVTDIPF